MNIIETQRSLIDIPDVNSAQLLLNYYQENQQHLAPWVPIRGSDYLTLEYWQESLTASEQAFSHGSEFKFVALTKNRQEVIGICNFTGVTRGAFQACFLGYSISQRFEGQGLMTEILSAGIDYMFKEVGLHRIMANYMPENKRSAAVLAQLGFEKEGFARDYLMIAGQWRDHVLTAKING
jgi:ribosomal-protein-alanine N-acetyltransferase